LGLLEKTVKRTIGGWGRHPLVETDLRTPSARAAVLADIAETEGHVARGNGRAYGDAAIGATTTLALTGLNRMVSFDPATGELTLEAGVLLGDVIDVFLPRGFFPAVVPGTRLITIGGAIAADVHGKNHHREGGFGDHVVAFTVATGSNGVLRASRDENPDLFFATIGGMGLTGTILEATIRLRPIETGWVRQTTIVAPDLTAAMAALEAADATTYSVAWIDCVAKGAALGRSLVFLGEHAKREEIGARAQSDCFPRLGVPRLAVPIDFPSIALSHPTVAVFNELYFRLGARKAGDPFLVPIGPYFFPLDGVGEWNRIYGRRGFVQHQCVLPNETAPAALAELLGRIARRGTASFLAVLKKLGGSNGLLSFPRPGWTLALDFPIDHGLFDFLNELDDVVVAAGGRLYLAKDARQQPSTFEAGYPNLARFREIRSDFDPRGRVRSKLSVRLGL
jgi:FAD/FMN-containing dehydrogenase